MEKEEVDGFVVRLGMEGNRIGGGREERSKDWWKCEEGEGLCDL